MYTKPRIDAAPPQTNEFQRVNWEIPGVFAELRPLHAMLSAAAPLVPKKKKECIFFGLPNSQPPRTPRSHTKPSILYPVIAKSPPHPILQISKQQLKSVTQIQHARVRGTVQLEAVRDDLDRPIHELGVLAGLEAEIEVAGIFGVDAEDVDAAFRVRFRVGG